MAYTLTSTNKAQMAVDCTSHRGEATGSAGVYWWEFYTGYQRDRTLTFDFPSSLPTSNITISEVKLTRTIESTNGQSNMSSFSMTIAGSEYRSSIETITLSPGDWTEALSSRQINVVVSKMKYQPKRYQGAATGSSKTCGVYLTFQATITWSYDYHSLSKPSNVSLSPTHITSSSSSTLSWSAVSNSPYANSVSKYEVYKDGTLYKTITSGTSCSVSGAAGDYYNFTVKAISDVSGYDSDKSDEARLYVYGNDYSADLTLYTDKNTTPAKTIYIGNTGQPTILPTIGYKTADYDSYSSYRFTQTTTTSGKAGTYTLTVYFSSGRSATSTAEVKFIGTPTDISFTTQPPTDSVYGSNPGYRWTETTAENASSVGYWVTNKTGTWAQEGVTHVQNILEYANNEAFTISVQPHAYGPYGGYTDGTKITSRQAYRANTISAGTITTGIKGANIDDEEIAKTYVFGETTLWWNYTPAEHGGDLASVSYSRISTKDDGTSTTYYGGPEDITSNNSSYGDSVSGLSKSTLSYTITFTDEYNQTYTAGPYTIEKLDAPSVELTGITSSTPVPPIQGATLHFIISPVGASTYADMRYKIEIGYGDEFYEIQPEKAWNTDTSCAVQYNLKTIAAAGGMPTLYEALTRTATAPLGKPILRYRLTAYDVNVPIATGVAYGNLETDFTTKPTLTGTLAAKNTSNSTLSYANSTDAITISGITATHKNFFGDETTDHLTNTLIRNGNMTLVNEAVGGQHFPFTSTLGTISADSTYNYVYTVRKQYSDAYTDDFATCSLPVKKWVEPLVSLTNLDWSSSGTSYSITGRLYSGTALWGGSPSVDNIKQIDISINTVDDAGTEIEARHYTFEPVGNLIDNQQYATFSISRPEMVDTQLNAKAIITSTSNKTYTLSAPLVLVKEQGIPFAIRKHGTGVNIPKGFNPSTNDAAIQITGNMDTDNVATFTNGPNRDNTDFIIQNDKGGTADTGKARLSLHKNDTEWTLSIIFD